MALLWHTFLLPFISPNIILTSIKYFLTISLLLNVQMHRSGEWMEWSALMIKKCLDVWANSLKKYNKKHIEENTHVDIGAWRINRPFVWRIVVGVVKGCHHAMLHWL